MIVKLDTNAGYKIHPLTRDSIHPVLNSMGDTIKTGIPIVVTGKYVDLSSVEKPKTTPVSWVTKGIPVTNVYEVPDKLTVLPVDESKLKKNILGKGTSSSFFLDNKGDTVPTGVPVTAIGKLVPCKLPKPVDALPMSRDNATMYRMPHLDPYHGLRISDAESILKDRRGNLWIYSFAGGLSCYDGKSFIHFTGNEGIIGKYIYSILEDRKGNIWFDCGAEGITRYDGANFLNFPSYVDKNKFGGTLNGIMEDRNGNLWFTSLINGLTKYDGKTFTHYTEKEGLTGVLTGALLEDSKGNLWIATNGNGVCRFDGKSFTYFTNKDDFKKDLVYCILEDRKGNLWFGTWGGLARYDQKSLTWFTEKDGLGKNLVYTMYEDKAGDLWISNMGKGLSRYDGKKFIRITDQEGLAGNFVTDISAGEDGGLWFATDKGISYYDGRFIYHQGLTGLPDNASWSIIVDHKGNILFGDAYGGGVLYRYDGHLISHLTRKKDSKTYFYPIRALLEDSSGNIWMGATDGLLCYDGKHLIKFTKKTGLISDTVSSLLQDSKGNIWIGTRDGLTRYDGKSLLHFTEREGLINNVVRSIYEDSKRNIWIGTTKGITKYDGKSFTHYTEKEGFNANFVEYIIEDLRGNILLGGFGTRNGKGLVRFDGNSLTYITEREGLAGNSITSMHKDSLGNIWVTTSKGLSKIPSGYADSRQISTGQQPGIVNYGLRDGLGSGDILTAFQDHHNRLWFLESESAASLTTIDMSYRTSSEKPPSVSLRDLNINDKFIDFRNPDTSYSEKIRFSNVTPFYNCPENLTLAYYLNRLTFHFIASGQLAENNIFYSYKLDGLGNDWSNPSTENKARYEYLPPGTYTFNVRAMDRSQIWGEPFQYKFTILAPFWQRWWFWSVIGLFVAGIVAWLLQKRINTIRKRENEKTESVKRIAELELESQKAVLNERLRISRELHDEVGATLSGIAMYSHLAKEQIKNSNTAEVEKSLNVMQQSSGEMVNKLNDIVWLVNPEQDSLQKLIERLEEYARNMASIKDMQVKINIPGKITQINLPVESRRNIYLFCKEAINNAVKYSGGDLLELNITEHNGTLEFTVSDNGKGFDAVMVRRGNGLENMQKRADEIGAKLILHSKLNEGVMVSMQCKITQ